MITGGCHCGSVRYGITSSKPRHSLCHCTDCRRATGAPAVSWLLISRSDISIKGELSDYASSKDAIRQFCPKCGTSLFYLNEAIFPGMIDVQSATLDKPDAVPLSAQIQVAERIGWMGILESLPSFDRYPS